MENSRKHEPLPERRSRKERNYVELSLEEVREIIESKCGDVCVVETHGEGQNKVIILPEAFQEFKVLVSYRRRSPMNERELMFTGYGHFLTDKMGHTIVIVKHFIQTLTTIRTPVSASILGPNGEPNPTIQYTEYIREEFLEREKTYNKNENGYEVDPFIDMCGNSEYVMEGHTHPDLGVFYSYADRESGAARAAVSPVCIFVCDPVRQEMLASIGRNFEKAEVIVYDYKGKEINAIEKRTVDSPENEIARLACQCLHARGYSGKIKIHTSFNGKICMKIKMVIPKSKRGK